MSNLPERGQPLADSGPQNHFTTDRLHATTPAAKGYAQPPSTPALRPRSPMGCAQPPTWGWSFYSSFGDLTKKFRTNLARKPRSSSFHSSLTTPMKKFRTIAGQRLHTTHPEPRATHMHTTNAPPARCYLATQPWVSTWEVSCWIGPILLRTSALVST